MIPDAAVILIGLTVGAALAVMVWTVNRGLKERENAD